MSSFTDILHHISKSGREQTMSAVIIEHVNVADLPETWRARLPAPRTAHVTVRIESEETVAMPDAAIASGFVTSDPAFGIWRDREDMWKPTCASCARRATTAMVHATKVEWVLVDSDVLIWHLRGLPHATQRLDRLPHLIISAITWRLSMPSTRHGLRRCSAPQFCSEGVIRDRCRLRYFLDQI